MSKHIKFYTDGSYSHEANQCSYGYIAIDSGNKIKYKYCCSKESKIGLDSVYSELKAVMIAVKFIKRLNLNYKVEICYDFTGVKDYLKKKKSNNSEKNNFINAYIDFMNEHEQYYTLRKVKAHSGNIFNNIVDKIVKYSSINESNRGMHITC